MPEMPDRFEPLGSRVLVKEDVPEKKVGSIEIPDTVQATAQSGVVVAVSSESECVFLLDRRVLFRSHAGYLIRLDDEPFRVLDDSEVLGAVAEDGG